MKRFIFFLFGKFFILSVCKKIYASGGKNMSYKLDIKDDALRICGLFGTYEAADDGSGGFLVSVQQDS